MASLYQRPLSSFWWIKWKDPASGKILRESTHLKIGDGLATRAARRLRDQRSLLELKPAGSVAARWENWVLDFIRVRHQQSPGTLSRKLTAWATLAEWLKAIKVAAPDGLTRQHCLAYLTWRSQLGSQKSRRRRTVSHNTILLELKVLSSTLHEALNRGWIQSNPATKLGLQRAPVRVKNEITDAQVQVIRAEIARRRAGAESSEEQRNADFLHVSFEIAIAQGIRLSETCLPVGNFDTVHQRVRILAKGRREYFAQLNPALLPLIEQWRAEGRTHTYIRPRMGSLLWFKFFDRLRKRDPAFNHISFHSARVTVISRLEAAGAPVDVVMELVNHSSTTVHRVYQRRSEAQLRQYWSALPPA